MKLKITLFAFAILFLYGCAQTQPNSEVNNVVNLDNSNYKNATFAGGCFWCSESDFEKIDGVIEVYSGYIGGESENPSYKEVSSGKTGHREAVQVVYDPNKVDYNKLLDVFWRHINPTDNGGQFADRGFQYTTAIFYHDDEQKKLAEASLKKLNQSGRFEDPIVTPIIPVSTFYKAEEYHQDYHKKNPVRYKFYRKGSGRDDFIEENWQDVEEEEITVSINDYSTYVKPSKEELKQSLSELQFHVTQKDGTEKPFDNEYNDNKEEGIYVDILSGEPLYSSTHKFDSGTGWPSFTQAIDEQFIVRKTDYKLIYPRTEIRSKYGDNHIGHVFNDGPKENGGKRHCMNSAALKFIPKDKMVEEGYEEYLYLFDSNT